MKSKKQELLQMLNQLFGVEQRIQQMNCPMISLPITKLVGLTKIFDNFNKKWKNLLSFCYLFGAKLTRLAKNV